MIDYFAHVSALHVSHGAIANSPLASQKPVSEALSAVSAQPGSAILGALVDHLLQYAQAPTSVEIGLLKKTATVFAEARTMLNKLAAVRLSLETSMAAPTAPGALAAYNAAASELPAIATDFRISPRSFRRFRLVSLTIGWRPLASS